MATPMPGLAENAFFPIVGFPTNRLMALIFNPVIDRILPWLISPSIIIPFFATVFLSGCSWFGDADVQIEAVLPADMDMVAMIF